MFHPEIPSELGHQLNKGGVGENKLFPSFMRQYHSRKRHEIRPPLLLMTNRKLHTIQLRLYCMQFIQLRLYCRDNWCLVLGWGFRGRPIWWCNFRILKSKMAADGQRSLHITSSNIGRFSKFFHCHILQEICNKMIIKYPTSPETCRYTICQKTS